MNLPVALSVTQSITEGGGLLSADRRRPVQSAVGKPVPCGAWRYGGSKTGRGDRQRAVKEIVLATAFPLEMVKDALILGVLVAANACNAFAESSLWSISEGKDSVIEILSEERFYCGNYCYSFAVKGRPDEIFVSPFREKTLLALREGEVKTSSSYSVYVIDLKNNMARLVELEQFLKLDIVFEKLPVRLHEAHPELNYEGDPDGHEYVAPIQRKGKEFVAALSSVRKTSEKNTFGAPSIIPFMGRQKWVQREEFHKGTFMLEIFDSGVPSKPIVQLQKEFVDLRRLPPIQEVASWAQGAEEPILVVVDNDSTIKQRMGRILVVRPYDDEPQ